jgi:ectoine hydroxylase-related dioxygenase (phytanoyl-CoA dioxygenase family)
VNVEQVVDAVRGDGFAVVEGVLDGDLQARVREAMYRVQRAIVAEVGSERLSNELGALRIPMKFDDAFFELLELPEVLAVIDATLGRGAILQRQTGLVLPSLPPDATPEIPQNSLHMDFHHVLGGELMAVNTLIAVDEFTAGNGGTVIVPRSHQADPRPDPAQLARDAVPVECPAGSMLAFDSTLWHASGRNVSGRDRLAVNQQFAPPYLKQQFDYVRALGDDKVLAQKPRTRQLLGWYSRVVSSLDEYYRAPEERLYRPGDF